MKVSPPEHPRNDLADAFGGNGAPEAMQQAEPVELRDLLSCDFPPRAWLLRGLVQERDLAMVHAFRGVGKSRFVHGLAVAVASGGHFLRFHAPVPKNVLLVDGELPKEDLQKMFAQAVAASDSEPTASFRLLSADLSDAPLRSLATDIGRQQVELHLDGVSFLVLDAITTLCPGVGPENESESWEVMQEWLLELRRRGITVLLVHHEGKGGKQRGTSKREDVLSQVVQLTRPAGYQACEGARFEVHFTKSRGLIGEAAEPFEAQLRGDPNGNDVWTWSPLRDVVASKAKELSDAGLTQREIAENLGIGLGTANRAVKRARQAEGACSSVPTPANETRNTGENGEGGGER